MIKLIPGGDAVIVSPQNYYPEHALMRGRDGMCVR